MGGWGDGPESVELRFHEAGTLMRRCVDQPVAGHDSVLADAANPVVAGMVVAFEAHEFDAAIGAEEKVGRGLVTVAAVMVSRGAQIVEVGNLSHDFAGSEVASVAEVGSRPDDVIDDEHIGWRSESRFAGGLPEFFAGGGIDSVDGGLVGSEDAAAVDNERCGGPADTNCRFW